MKSGDRVLVLIQSYDYTHASGVILGSFSALLLLLLFCCCFLFIFFWGGGGVVNISYTGLQNLSGYLLQIRYAVRDRMYEGSNGVTDSMTLNVKRGSCVGFRYIHLNYDV